jgi:hypothetical protein
MKERKKPPWTVFCVDPIGHSLVFCHATIITLVAFSQSAWQAIVVTFSTKDNFFVLLLQVLHKANNGSQEITKGIAVMCSRLHNGYIRLKCIIEQCCV